MVFNGIQWYTIGSSFVRVGPNAKALTSCLFSCHAESVELLHFRLKHVEQIIISHVYNKA